LQQPRKRRKPTTQDNDDAPKITGVTPKLSDEDAAYAKAVAAWRETEKLVAARQAQRIVFNQSPICLVFAGDLHLGGEGVDYPRIFAESKIVVDTPGMYLVLVGDLLNNFIVPKLMSARYKAYGTIEEEWVLVRKYLKLVAPKLLVSVGGNHEKWTWTLSAIDYFADVLRGIRADAIYDTDEALISLTVKKAVFPLRIRHRWLGNSIYNPTHGIERAAKWDQDFIVGVGAHTHVSGLVREFNCAGRTGTAVLCGTYKRVDPFARQVGFAKPNNNTAQAVLFFENGDMLGVSSLERAANLMRLYARK
jgi:hypothetical protein